MPATAILNPYSISWEAGRRAAEVETIMRQAGVDFELKVTDRPDRTSVPLQSRKMRIVRPPSNGNYLPGDP